MRRALVAGLATILSAMIVTPDTGNASSSTSHDLQLIRNQDPTLLAAMARQEALHPSAEILLGAAMRLPSDSGYAGIAYEADGVTVYYKGTLADEMAEAVATARHIAPVTVKVAAYSHAELAAAQAVLASAVAAGHVDIQAIGIRGDGSGLEVERIPAATRAQWDRQGRATTDATTVIAELRLAVPVSVTTATAPITRTSSRENDSPPWNGGGYFESYRGYEKRMNCTTGFGVFRGSQSYVLTAAHCMTAPDIAYNGHVFGCCYEQMGPVYVEDWRRDILLINARGFYWIFDGGPSSSITKTVHSWGYRVTNELLCTSGAASGVVCGDKTQSGGDWMIFGCDSDGDCFTMSNMAKAINVNGLTVGVKGDSGGPVFSLDRDGVRAKGTMSAVSGATALYYQDMDDIVSSLGATPRTA